MHRKPVQAAPERTTRLGARAAAASIDFDDAMNQQRLRDHIKTATANAVFNRLQRARLAGRVQVFR